jgi:hypothetical protein
MEMTFECPKCEKTNRLVAFGDGTAAACRCGWSKELSNASCAGGELKACLLCATGDLYIQKDFPHALGLAIVVVGFALSTVFWYLYRPGWTLGVLLGTAAVDVVLYYLVPDVTICYRCLSQYRGVGANPGGSYKPFDLAIGERYRQERLRIQELRLRDASREASPPV